MLLVDDHDLLRAGLDHACLSARPADIEVVGECADGPYRRQNSPADLEPDVVLMDVEMPEW